jgi:hypothetical protein
MPNTNLSRTPASAGNRKTWTYSTWLKLSDVRTTLLTIFSAGSFPPYTNDGYTDLQYRDYKFKFTGGANNVLVTTPVYRDVSAWYHVVLAVDTTQATTSNRVKFYINGLQITAFDTATYPAQNDNYAFNNNVVHSVGSNTSAGSYFDGLMASTYFIDGQALTPSSFGEIDATTGIWKFKSYSGSYGTNGFFLKYENSASLGLDSSGNGNNFTVNGTPTQTVDTPSNVFATWNPLGNSSGTYSNGNLTRSGGNDTISTFGVTAGKWYWEHKLDTQGSGGSASHWGIVSSNSQKNADDYVSSVAGFGAIFIRHDYAGTINSYASGGFSSMSNTNISSVTFTNNDIIGCAVDLNSATKELKMYKNNVHILTSTFSYDGTTPVYAYVRYNSGSSGSVNFGNGRFGTTAISSPFSDGAGLGKFQYAVPAGYYSLCTKNINSQG